MTKVVGTTINTTLPAMISDDRLAFNSASDIMLDGEVVAILQALQQHKSPSTLDVNEKSGGMARSTQNDGQQSMRTWAAYKDKWEKFVLVPCTADGCACFTRLSNI